MDANSIIKRTIKEKFTARELKQKGQSRLWYFNGNYYLILIEFQPSSWDTGAYLNVGLDFNWYPKDYFSFEFGHRLSDFKTFADATQFETEVKRLCDLALDKVNEYIQILSDKETAAEKLLKLHKDKSNDWENFHLGVLFGLGGQNHKAINYLRKVTKGNYKLGWEIEREKIARGYIKAIEEGHFLATVDEVIKRTKELRDIS